MLATIRRFFVLGFIICALPTWCDGAEPAAVSSQFDSARLGEIRGKMQAFVDQQQIAGAVTVVGTAQNIVSQEAVGWQNIERRQPMSQNALFRIASMTKPITSIGIMVLVDEGKLSVEDPVEKHLPEFQGQMLVANRAGDTVSLKKPPRPITLRDLLTHTSGLPSYPAGLSKLYQDRDRTLAESTLVISQRPLDFEPGSKWSYCNSGIDTLGRIIEVVSGKPYEEFLAERVFRPLDMTDTTFRPTKQQLQRLAALYDRKDDKLVPVGYVLLGPAKAAKHPIPAGGLYSTGADLARVYQMMLNHGRLGDVRVLSEAAVEKMTSLQTGELECGFTPGMGWGLGWSFVRKPQGVTAMLSSGTFGHGGAFGTQGWIDPHKGVFVIMLIQRVGLQNGDASDMRRAFQTAAFGAIR